MSQKLILPLNQTQVLCGYKNAAYQKAWGFAHYGMDLYDPSLVLWAMGDGEVLAAGTDSIFGNCVVVLYKDVYIHATGQTKDLIARCYHMDDVPLVKAGDKISTKTRLGTIGTTGKYSSGVHLHVEFDTDTQHPMMVPGLSGNTSMFQRGIDTTIDPAEVLYVKPTAPDNQTIGPNQSYLQRGFLSKEDYTLPILEQAPQPDFEAKYNEVLTLYQQEKANSEQAAQQLAKTLADYKACYEQLTVERQKHQELLASIAALVGKYSV